MPTPPYIVGAPERPSSTDLRIFHDCDNTAGWSISGSSVTYDGVSGHPGVFTITSAAAQYSQSRLNWGPATTVLPFNISDFQRITWVFKYDSVTNIQGWFGLYGTSSGPTGDQTQTNSIMAFISNAALTFNVNNASTSSATTSVTIAANTWYKFDIVRDSATVVSLYVNDVLAASITTGVPSGTTCGLGGRLMTLANPGAKIWYFDMLDADFQTTTARY